MRHPLNPERIFSRFYLELTRGVTPQLEMSVETGWAWFEETNGMADTTIGAKLKHTAEEDLPVLAALILDLKLPTASRSKGLGTGDVEFAVLGGLTVRPGPRKCAATPAAAARSLSA